MSAAETTYRLEVIAGAAAGVSIWLGAFAAAAYSAVHGHGFAAMAILFFAAMVKVKVKRSKRGSGEAVAAQVPGDKSREAP